MKGGTAQFAINLLNDAGMDAGIHGGDDVKYEVLGSSADSVVNDFLDDISGGYENFIDPITGAASESDDSYSDYSSPFINGGEVDVSDGYPDNVSVVSGGASESDYSDNVSVVSGGASESDYSDNVSVVSGGASESDYSDNVSVVSGDDYPMGVGGFEFVTGSRIPSTNALTPPPSPVSETNTGSEFVTGGATASDVSKGISSELSNIYL
jgi:hypothetical protein